jgi:hypothetical protein
MSQTCYSTGHECHIVRPTKLHDIGLSEGAVLKTGYVYIVP